MDALSPSPIPPSLPPSSTLSSVGYPGDVASVASPDWILQQYTRGNGSGSGSPLGLTAPPPSYPPVPPQPPAGYMPRSASRGVEVLDDLSLRMQVCCLPVAFVPRRWPPACRPHTAALLLGTQHRAVCISSPRSFPAHFNHLQPSSPTCLCHADRPLMEHRHVAPLYA